MSSPCLGRFLQLSCVPGWRPAVPASPTQHLVRGSAWWGCPGAAHRRPWGWVQGMPGFRVGTVPGQRGERLSCPSAPLSGDSPSQPIAQPRPHLYKARAAGSSFGSVLPSRYGQPLSTQPRQVLPAGGSGGVGSGGSRGCRRLAWLWKGACMSAPPSSCTQAGQCVRTLTLCLGGPPQPVSP